MFKAVCCHCFCEVADVEDDKSVRHLPEYCPGCGEYKFIYRLIGTALPHPMSPEDKANFDRDTWG